jgi:general secretion pathway protein N
VKRGLWIALLATLAFIAIFMARMPAAWIIPTHDAQATCAAIDGTLLSGACGGLVVQKNPVGDVTWELHPASLLVGKLAAHVVVTRGPATLSTDVEAGFGQKLTLRHLLADLPLDPAVIPGVPTTLRGRAHLDLALARLEQGALRELQGRIEAHDLQDRSGLVTPLGSYSVTFPGGPGDTVGKIRDLDGPLAVEGTLRLTSQPGYEIEGLVAARTGAPPELINNLRYLGSPDATGRRPFSVAGTF